MMVEMNVKMQQVLLERGHRGRGDQKVGRRVWYKIQRSLETFSSPNPIDRTKLEKDRRG